MKQELGKWLMDIAKYITTAVILSSVFGDVEPWVVYWIGAVAVGATLISGLYLVNIAEKQKNNNKKKK